MKKLHPILFLLFLGYTFIIYGCGGTAEFIEGEEVSTSFDLHTVGVNAKGSPLKARPNAGLNFAYWMTESFSPPSLNMGNHSGNLMPIQPDLAFGHGPYHNPSFLYPDSVVHVAEGVKKPSGNFLSLSEGLQLVEKGYKTTVDNRQHSTSLYYAEIPVLINYNYAVNKGNYLYAGVGPYVAAGLFGKFKSTNQGQTKTTSVIFGSGNNADYKRMDYGVSFKLGYNFLKTWDIFFDYDYGLSNINPATDNGLGNIMNRSMGLNVGYRF